MLTDDTVTQVKANLKLKIRMKTGSDAQKISHC